MHERNLSPNKGGNGQSWRSSENFERVQRTKLLEDLLANQNGVSEGVSDKSKKESEIPKIKLSTKPLQKLSLKKEDFPSKKPENEEKLGFEFPGLKMDSGKGKECSHLDMVRLLNDSDHQTSPILAQVLAESILSQLFTENPAQFKKSSDYPRQKAAQESLANSFEDVDLHIQALLLSLDKKLESTMQWTKEPNVVSPTQRASDPENHRDIHFVFSTQRIK